MYKFYSNEIRKDDLKGWSSGSSKEPIGVSEPGITSEYLQSVFNSISKELSCSGEVFDLSIDSGDGGYSGNAPFIKLRKPNDAMKKELLSIFSKDYKSRAAIMDVEDNCDFIFTLSDRNNDGVEGLGQASISGDCWDSSGYLLDLDCLSKGAVSIVKGSLPELDRGIIKSLIAFAMKTVSMLGKKYPNVDVCTVSIVNSSENFIGVGPNWSTCFDTLEASNSVGPTYADGRLQCGVIIGFNL